MIKNKACLLGGENLCDTLRRWPVHLRKPYSMTPSPFFLLLIFDYFDFNILKMVDVQKLKIEKRKGKRKKEKTSSN